MSSLCRYKDSLGVVRQGIHKPRVLYMARNDWIMTIIFAFALTFCFFWPNRPRQFGIMFLVILITVEGLAIILHRMFCVRTQMDEWLFGK